YKGHAIRHSLAHRYGLAALTQGPRASSDPWADLFQQARADFAEAGHSELVPYWVVPDAQHKITRHVPAYPLSKDVERYERLKSAVATYRLVFGQPRQEDLLAYLQSQLHSRGHEQPLPARPIDLSPRSAV
ncbi:MAG: helicase, partial [Candidatus Brocadiia bacterium]